MERIKITSIGPILPRKTLRYSLFKADVALSFSENLDDAHGSVLGADFSESP